MEIIPRIHQVDGINANSYLIVGDMLRLSDGEIEGAPVQLTMDMN